MGRSTITSVGLRSSADSLTPRRFPFSVKKHYEPGRIAIPNCRRDRIRRRGCAHADLCRPAAPGSKSTNGLNTTSVQVAAYQDLNAQVSHFNELLLDPGVAQVFERMTDTAWSWSKFDPVQRRQARSLLYMRIRHADMAYYQFERGMLSEDRLNSALRPLLSDIDKPIFRSFWAEVGPLQVPAFRDYLNRRIAEKTH